MKKRIVTILGARPQIIKASVVSAAIAASAELEEVLVHTGQHFDHKMSDVFFEDLGMRQPEYNLNIHGGGHGSMTGRMLIELEELLLKVRPDAVMVYGDTNSTLAGALAAVKLHIPVAHVEAGLRSFNMAMPEEVNRILTDRVSRWLFAPTEVAAGHLQHEGFAAEQIIQVGDVMFDVARTHGRSIGADGLVLGRVGLGNSRYLLATVHRAENADAPDRLEVIVAALKALSTDMPVGWPLHPRTLQALGSSGQLDAVPSGLHIVEPVGYLEMVQLERFAAAIITDSGGVQKEAFFHQVPCVTLRDETEWTELVQAGWNRLAPPRSVESVVAAVRAALNTRGQEVSPYGKGDAAVRIADALNSGLLEGK